MPIVRDKTTGKRYEVDNAGNVLREISGSTTVNIQKDVDRFGGGRVPRSERTSKSRDKEKAAKTPDPEETRQSAASLIPLVTGSAGAIVGGPMGAGLGAFSGDLIKQELQNQWPNTFGKLPESEQTPGGALLNAGVEGVSNFAGDWAFGKLGTYASRIKLGTLKDKASEWLLKSRLFRGEKMEPEVRQFLSENPDMPITAGQATGNKISQFLEANLGGTRGREIRKEQQGIFKDRFESEARDNVSSTDPERLALTASSKVQEGSDSLMKDVNRVYANLRGIAKQNVTKVQGKPKESKILDANGKPIQTPVEESIEGPIVAGKAYEDAKYLLDKIQKDYGLQNADELLPFLEEEQRAAFRALKRFADSAVDKSGKPVAIPLNVALDAKRIIGNRAFRSFFGDMESQRLQQLNRNLDEDIRTSIGKWGKNGSEALKQYALGNKYFQTHAELFKETPGITGLLQGGPGTIENVQTILRDPVQLRRTLVAVDDNGQTKKALKSEFLSDIFNSAFSKAEGKFSKGTAFEMFGDRDKQPIINQLFTGEEKRSLQRFFKTIDKVNADIPFNSATSLGWSLARQGAAVAASTLPFAFTGEVNETSLAFSGLILGGIIGAKQFTKNVLLNPRMVRIATDLAQLPPDSLKAKQLARVLFQGMKGTRITLQLVNGMTAEAEINAKGEIDPRFSLPKQEQSQ